MHPFKIIYCGLDLTAWEILMDSEKFEVSGVNRIPDFLTHKTLNPLDWLFKAIYALRCRNICPRLEKILASLYWVTAPLSSNLYRRYADYLENICKKNIPIIDFGDAEWVEKFVQATNTPLILVNNWWLLPDRIINAPAMGTVNIHPSRLPQYRGSLPTLWTLKNGDKDTAVSFIKLSREMDRGNIIAQHPITISADETAVSLEGKIESVLYQHLENTLIGYMNGATLLAQDNALASTTARYFDYMPIDWATEKAKDIADKINLYPYLWPAHRCWSFLGDRKIEISRAALCRAFEPLTQSAPGAFYVKGRLLFIKTLDGILKTRLFRDVGAVSSMILFFKQKGQLGEKK